MKFNLESFVNQIEKADGLGEDQVYSHIRMLTTMRLILDSDQTKPELLAQVSIEDLEWAFDLMLYWPDWEEDSNEVDLNHQGVQHAQIQYIVKELSSKKSIPRKATFI